MLGTGCFYGQSKCGPISSEPQTLVLLGWERSGVHLGRVSVIPSLGCSLPHLRNSGTSGTQRPSPNWTDTVTYSVVQKPKRPAVRRQGRVLGVIQRGGGVGTQGVQSQGVSEQRESRVERLGFRQRCRQLG